MDPADDVSSWAAGRLLTLTGVWTALAFQAGASGAEASASAPLSWLSAIRWPRSTSWPASSPKERSSWL